jgi:hypothetical protein
MATGKLFLRDDLDLLGIKPVRGGTYMRAKLLRCAGVCALGGALVLPQGSYGQQGPRAADPLRPEAAQHALRQLELSETLGIALGAPAAIALKIKRETARWLLRDPNRPKELRDYHLIPLIPVRNWQEPTPAPEGKKPSIPPRKPQ